MSDTPTPGTRPLTPGIAWLRQIVESLPLAMGHGAISRISVLDAIDNVIRSDAERAASAGDGLRAGKRSFGPCAKCGCVSDILVAFHAGEKAYAGQDRYPSCDYSPECGVLGKAGEHLRVRCRRCQWGWTEEARP